MKKNEKAVLSPCFSGYLTGQQLLYVAAVGIGVAAKPATAAERGG